MGLRHPRAAEGQLREGGVPEVPAEGIQCREPHVSSCFIHFVVKKN